MNSFDPLTRRRFLRAVTVAGGAMLAASPTHAAAPAAATKDSASLMAELMKPGSEKILILLYPGFTALDAIGPEYALSCMMGATVRFIAKTAKPVRTESGFEVTPHLTFEQLPEKPSLFIVPGGTKGTIEAIEDAATRDFVHKAGSASEFAGSVCTGSLLLGAAGLLNGYEATSHWQTLELLPIFGAKPSKKRVVFDRNRVTGAGVTAGLDFSLELVRHFRGDSYAKGVQLLGQYDPQPPFAGGGNPDTADPRLVTMFNEMHRPFIAGYAESIRKTQTSPATPRNQNNPPHQ
jgi:cyclohexyl-isocyanide hydratase